MVHSEVVQSVWNPYGEYSFWRCIGRDIHPEEECPTQHHLRIPAWRWVLHGFLTEYPSDWTGKSDQDDILRLSFRRLSSGA